MYHMLRVEKLNLIRYVLMKQHVEKTSDGLVAFERDPENTDACSDRLVALSCYAGVWLCGTALSTIGLALPGRSDNVLLRLWQDVCILHNFYLVTCLMRQPVGIFLQQSSSFALAGSVALCSAGYAAACTTAYHQNPSGVAGATALCIIAFFVEGLWNGLYLSPMERLALMPIAINIGVTLGLKRRRSPGPRSVPIFGENV